MGIEASKELAEHVSRACSNAHGRTRVDDILFQNESFVKRLREAWNDLPSESKSKIHGHKHRGASAISRSNRRIFLSASIIPYYSSWEADSSSFLASDVDIGVQFPQRPLVLLYSLLSRLETRRQVDRIRWRFILLTFYRLKKELQSTFGNYILDIFVKIIIESGFIIDAEPAIRQNLNKWANSGRRYDGLVEKLGYGCLILLPDDISAHEWEWRIPLTGPIHDEAIASLKQRGILLEARRINADPVGLAIFEYLWGLLKLPRVDCIEPQDHELHLRILADATCSREQQPTTTTTTTATTTSHPHGFSDGQTVQHHRRQYIPEPVPVAVPTVRPTQYAHQYAHQAVQQYTTQYIPEPAPAAVAADRSHPMTPGPPLQSQHYPLEQPQIIDTSLHSHRMQPAQAWPQIINTSLRSQTLSHAGDNQTMQAAMLSSIVAQENDESVQQLGTELQTIDTYLRSRYLRQDFSSRPQDLQGLQVVDMSLRSQHMLQEMLVNAENQNAGNPVADQLPTTNSYSWINHISTPDPLMLSSQ